jgi:hypothetical protein
MTGLVTIGLAASLGLAQIFHQGAKRGHGDLGCSFRDIFIGVSGIRRYKTA